MQKRGRRLGRKGQGHYLMNEIFQLAASMMVMITELAYVGGLATGLSLEKNLYARDISLMLDLMYGCPTNFNYLYSIKAKGEELFIFNASNFNVYISATEHKLPADHYFYENLKMNRFSSDLGEIAGMLRFFKQGNSIQAATEGKGNEILLACSGINTKKGGWKTTPVIIDAAAGGSDKGNTNSRDPGFYEADVSLKIAKAMGLAGRIENNKMTRTADVFRDDAARKKTIEEGTGIVVSIGVGKNTDKSRNEIRVYFNANADSETREKSAKLACLVANSVMSNENLEGVTGGNIAPAYSDIFPEDRIGIIVEAGNIEVDKGKNFLNNPSQIAKSISDAITGYFS